MTEVWERDCAEAARSVAMLYDSTLYSGSGVTATPGAPEGPRVLGAPARAGKIFFCLFFV